MQAISGAPYTLSFDFRQDGEYVVPDDGTVFYTLYDNAGAAIGAQTDVAVTTDNNTNQVQITILAGQHTIGVGKDFEQRTLRVKYKVSGKDYLAEQWYYVTGALNFRVTPADVIVLMGIKEGEVLFEEIDLVQAYFKVANAVTSAVLVSSLSSGDIKQIKINEAIKITAALDLMRVIELKAFRKFGNELNYSRFDKIDFAAIRASLESALVDIIGVIGDEPGSAGALFVVTNPVNPMTG